MSAVAGAAGAAAPGSRPARVVAAPPSRSVVPVLALRESRRLLLHPFTLVGFGIYLVATVATLLGDEGPRSAFETISLVQAFYPGTMLVLAGAMLATRDLRAGSSEVLGPLPGRAEERVKALLLAAAAPAVVGLVLTLGLHAVHLGLDRYAHTPDGVPGPWHILGGPVTLLGATVFGVMVGVWLPGRVSALLGLVALVVYNLAIDSRGEYQLLGMAVPWARWGLYPDSWAGVVDGSPALHVGYLFALCGMAAAAAWVRVADRRTAPVALGLVALAVAVAAGIGQLP